MEIKISFAREDPPAGIIVQLDPGGVDSVHGEPFDGWIALLRALEKVVCGGNARTEVL